MDLEADVQIGDFKIEKRLGAGGMGIVYQARQLSLNRLVALKILGSALDRKADIARFQREAQAVARLHHPGIASIYFIGQDQNVCYLAMEFIDGVSLRKVLERMAAVSEPGETLDSVLRQIPLGAGAAPAIRFDQPTETFVPSPGTDNEPPPKGGISRLAAELIASAPYIRRSCELVREAAKALAHAHERGVIHRDVKPENLLLDRSGQMHVIDFGIARFHEDVTVTHTGALIGTPMYMSPEQVSGRIDVDHRSDIYSLGLVLYELLSLRPPIMAATREGILRQIATKAMPPVTWQNRAVPHDLANVVHKATAKDPDDRYESASEFASDLQAFLDGRPVAAVPYRYKFDAREIVATRPKDVTFAGFWALFTATYKLISSSASIWTALHKSGPRHVDPFDGISLLFGVACVVTGLGMLSGRAWSRWGVIILGLATGIEWWGYVLEILKGVPIDQISSNLMTGFVVSIIWLAIIIIVCRRRTRDWFRLADRLRSAHDQHVTSAH